ncbi:hypothetical protein MY3296_007930 [Beauveria thailandica]
MSCHLPFAISDRGVASTNIEIAVGHVKYLLIESQDNFLECAGFDNDNGHTLVLVYTTSPDETISKSALREFQASTLSRDDVFQPDFASNMVFTDILKKAPSLNRMLLQSFTLGTSKNI